MSDKRERNTAYVTYSLMALNAVYFLLVEIVGSTENLDCMIRWGAVFPPLVMEKGEYWRLFTAVFMHFGIEHILNNMLILYVLGDYLERAMGKARYLILYLVSGVGANVVSLYIDAEESYMVVSAGASGAIFGMIGGLLYAVLINRGRLEDLSTKQLVVMIAFSLYFGFTSTGVDNVAHVAGLVIGMLVALILYRKPKKNSGWIKEE